MLSFRNIHHAYQKPVLKGVDLDVSKGSVLVLFGPSGCGKSTLLALAAGLQPVQKGSVSLDDVVLNSSDVRTPPEKLPIGLVFQSGALFPHMTIRQNIAFGMPTEARRDRSIDNWLELAGIRDTHKRFPHELSGGQQQRAALVRALATHPSVLLMDEPLANIDVTLRRHLRTQIRMILKSTGSTAILVTHDAEEALELGDEIAILDQGRIIQTGSAAELSEHPLTPQIASSIGDFQLIDAVLTEKGLDTEFGSWPRSSLRDGDAGRWGPVHAALRSHALTVAANENGTCVIEDVRAVFGELRLTLRGKKKGQLRATMIAPAGNVETGMRVSVVPRDQSIITFPYTTS